MDKYEQILAIVKDESVARGVIQSEILTGCDWKDIIKSMGFEIKHRFVWKKGWV